MRIQPALHFFQAVAQPVERRSQIVRDGIGDFAHAFHQPFGAIEHVVEVFGKFVELVFCAGYRHSARKITGHDLGAGAVDRIEPPQHVAADQSAADQTE